jgi:hypothetical protein
MAQMGQDGRERPHVGQRKMAAAPRKRRKVTMVALRPGEPVSFRSTDFPEHSPVFVKPPCEGASPTARSRQAVQAHWSHARIWGIRSRSAQVHAPRVQSSPRPSLHRRTGGMKDTSFFFVRRPRSPQNAPMSSIGHHMNQHKRRHRVHAAIARTSSSMEQNASPRVLCGAVALSPFALANTAQSPNEADHSLSRWDLV